MSRAKASNGIVQSIAAACAANVGPMLGVDLAVSTAAPLTDDKLPAGPYALLQVVLELNGDARGDLLLASPIPKLACLARRMLGLDDPDGERELSPDELDSVGEILTLWGSAAEQSVRERVSAQLRAVPAKWSQVEAIPAEGRSAWASAITVPGGSVKVPFLAWLSTSLLDASLTGDAGGDPKSALLIALEAADAEPLGKLLQAFEFAVASANANDPELDEKCASAGVLFLAASDPTALERCQALRRASTSWRKPIFVCAPTPSRAEVLAAVEAGATSVLILPTTEPDLKRLLTSRRTRRGH